MAKAELGATQLAAGKALIAYDTWGEDPAREAAELLRARAAEDLGGWYESLVMSFEEGGRPRALEFLEEQRHAGLTRMKVW